MKTKKILTVVLNVILWLVILLAAFFAFTTLATRNSDNVASLGGYTPLTVATDSMAPTFKSGDLIVIRKCDPATLKEGDIITFHTIIENRYALNTHRIESITEKDGYRTYVTKGDNNAIEDQHIITDSDIVGRYVFKLAGFGKFMNFLSSSTGFFIVIVLPMLAFFIYQVYHLIVVSAKLKKAMAAEGAEAASQIGESALQAQEAAEARTKAAEEKALEASAAAKAAEDKAREAEEKLAELERLKAEYEAKIAEAERLKEAQKDE